MGNGNQPPLLVHSPSRLKAYMNIRRKVLDEDLSPDKGSFTDLSERSQEHDF